jgi:hypothetical protein
MATRRGPDNSVRVAVSGTVNGQNWANVFWCQLTTSGTPTQSDLDTWTTAFAAAYFANFKVYSQAAVLYVQCQSSLFLPGGGLLPSVVAMASNGTGTATVTVPQDASTVISWQIGVYWRGGKPRTYLPLPTAGVILTNRVFSAANITAVIASAVAFKTAVNALTTGAISGTVLGTVSFRSNNADRIPPVFFAYQGAKMHPRVGSQRRRLGKWQP